MTCSLLSLSMLFSAAVGAFASAFERVGDSLASMARAMRDWLVYSFNPAPAVFGALDKLSSDRLTAASAFVSRMIKRETPRFEARWSMCPST